jgi:hypothetical protein
MLMIINPGDFETRSCLVATCAECRLQSVLLVPIRIMCRFQMFSSLTFMDMVFNCSLGAFIEHFLIIWQNC